MRFYALPLAIVALALSACGGGDSPTSNGTHTLTSVVITTTSGSTVQVGHSLQWVATPRDQNSVPMTATVSWSSSATAVATVTSTGLVSGVGAGAATITATATSAGITVSTTRQVTVTGGTATSVLTSVTINAPGTTIAAGASVQLSALPKDQNGTPVSATLAWSTSDNTKATVDNNGLVTTIAAGTVTITVTASAGSATVNNTVQLTIVPAGASVLTTLNVSPPSGSLASGQTLQLSAAALDQFGTLMAATVTWSTSSAQIATVSNTGLVMAVSDGSVTITASATAGAVTLMRPVPVTVQSFSLVADVTATLSNQFSPASVDIARGGTVTWNFQTTHNVTFSTLGSPTDIGNTDAGGSGARVFNTAGTFNYLCTLHAGMSGTVIVH
jgi:uncharacterized protein YjdB